MDYWLELNHREKTHTSEAGIWSTGRLQEKVTNRFGTNDQIVLLCRDCYGCDKAPGWKTPNGTIFLDSEAAAKVMVELLGSYTEDNASQARVDAHRYTNVLLLLFVTVLIFSTYIHVSASSLGVSSVLWKTLTPSWWTTSWHWNLSVSWRENSSMTWVLKFRGISGHLLIHPTMEYLTLFLLFNVSFCQNWEELLEFSHMYQSFEVDICLGWIYDVWLCLSFNVLLHWQFSASCCFFSC